VSVQGDELRSGHIDAFVGISSTQGFHADREPSLQLAFSRAAEQASQAGYAGTLFHASIEIVPEEHNQWIRTYRVIITPEG
jgi:hypothetical protein